MLGIRCPKKSNSQQNSNHPLDIAVVKERGITDTSKLSGDRKAIEGGASLLSARMGSTSFTAYERGLDRILKAR